jgi:hypothetical protein
MAGGGFYGPDSTCQSLKRPVGSCQLIYSDIMGGSAKETARCILLHLEIRDMAEIFKLGNPQAKMDYLETQKKLLLVSKIVDKNKKPSSGGRENRIKTVEELNIKTTGNCIYTWSRL